jgi:chemotaxis protein methyltransferase CheR
MLVVTRLRKRLHALGLHDFQTYVRLLSLPEHKEELQTAIDLLTTNETSFFREPAHFEFLRTQIVARYSGPEPLRVWSAACSSGEEPYTIAMVLAESCGESGWDVLGSDISSQVLARAATAQYSNERAHSIPTTLLHKYCLKGVGEKTGTFAIDAALRRRVQIRQINLVEPLPPLGTFDVIFLRNVMIYFDAATKARVVAQLSSVLKPGGWFFVSHCETLNGVNTSLTMIQPSIYRSSHR